MKHKKILLALGLYLAIMPGLLFAQKAKGIFNLKEGDWFEMKVKFTSNQFFFRKPEANKQIKEYLIRYSLKKTLENGDQQYDMTFKRVKLKTFNAYYKYWIGYDSYYPSYTRNDITPYKEIKISLTVSKNSKTATISEIPSSVQKITLSEISPKKNTRFTDTSIVAPILNEDLVPLIGLLCRDIKVIKSGPLASTYNTQVLFDSAGMVRTKLCKVNNQPVRYFNDVKTGVPSFIDISPEVSMLLTAASFKMPPNALIKGSIRNLGSNDEASVFLGDGLKLTMFSRNQKHSEEISLPLKLENLDTRNVNIKGKQVTILVKPGDTVAIIAEGNDLKNTIRFSGNVKNEQVFYKEFKDASLKQNYNSFYQSIQKIQSAEEYEKFKAQNEKIIEDLFNKHKRQITPESSDFIRNEWNFTKAISKLGFLMQNQYKSDSASLYPLHNFPKDFFLEIDTLSLTMNDYDYISDYDYFFTTWYLPYLSAKAQATSSSFEYSFYNDLYLSMASFKGYSVYKMVFELINRRLEEDNWQLNLKIKPYYEQFIERCKDPELLDSIKRKWAINESWKPGNNSPLQKLKLLNGKDFDLTQFKGKPFCVMVSGIGSRDLNRALQHVNQTKPDLPIVVAVVINRWNKGTDLDTSLLKLPNITFLKISNNEPELGSLNSTGPSGNKCFFFDKWFRVIDNNIPLEQANPKILDTLFQKAIKAERYTPQQKAEIIKTTGWSLGSILVTGLIGTGIYRRRMQKLKREENVKRRIKELEVKAIRSQMNPHFVFNALNSIQSLINANQFKEANIYLAKFAVLLRGVLNNSEKTFVSLSDELKGVKLYCELEQLRFYFKPEIKIGKEVNPDLTEIPGMIIQPLVENAIVHGLAQKAGQGLLTIEVTKENSLLKIAVTDNGVGLHQRKPDSLSQKGFGLKLVEERLKVLNFEGTNANLKVFANQDAGTTATITIPDPV